MEKCQKTIFSEIEQVYQNFGKKNTKKTKLHKFKSLNICKIVDPQLTNEVQDILLEHRKVWGFVHRSSVKQWLTTSKTIRVIGIFKKDALVGVLVYVEKPSHLKINYIAMKNSFKDKSIGFLFIKHLEESCKELGKYKIYAEVPKNNENGLRYFLKNDFLIEGILKEHTRGKKDLVLMAKYIM
jgi:ribosomal protein S18 acetylase RimI-like enzyme